MTTNAELRDTHYSEHDVTMMALRNIEQSLSTLKKALYDQAMTFCGHPTLTLRVLPGDVFVIKARNVITPEEAALIKNQAQSILPAGVNVMVVDSQLDVSLVRKET